MPQMLLSRMSRVVPLLAVMTACTRHPVVPEDERRPKVLESQWDLCGNGVHDPVFPCGGPFDIPEPNSPDSPNTISCAPSPVARGDTVTCTIELPKWQVPYATSDPDSVFKAVVILADTTGRFNESPSDSIYVIDFAYGDGAASTTANVWKWQLKGPAVTSSEFSVRMFAIDTLGGVHSVAAKTGFAVTEFPVDHEVAITAVVSSVSPTYEYSQPIVDFDSTGSPTYVFGRTFSPILYDGATSNDQEMVRAVSDDRVDTTAYTFATAGVGPNKSLRYLTTSLELAPVMTWYSVTILGQGIFADSQVGARPPASPSPPFCDRSTQANLWTLLGSTVRAHEGSVSGADSHFDYYKEAVNGPSGQALATSLQRRWFRTWSPSPLLSLNAQIRNGLRAISRTQHRALDSSFRATASSIAGCTWYLPK